MRVPPMLEDVRNTRKRTGGGDAIVAYTFIYVVSEA
jgi:hypothetical protein